MMLTDPVKGKDFVEKTGLDALAIFLSEGVLNGFDADDQVVSDVSDNLTPAIEFANKFN